jgi:hypothetical protein
VETPAGGGVLGGRRPRDGRRARTTRPDQHAALLIPRELLGLDELLFEGFERFVIHLEVDLERAIRHTLTLPEEGNHLIEDGIEVHRASSCTYGGKYRPTATHEQTRETTGYMYCK